MDKKLSILVVICTLILLVGCTGYKVPTYKAPATNDTVKDADAKTDDVKKATKDLGSDDDFDLEEIFEVSDEKTDVKTDTKTDSEEKVVYQVADETETETKDTKVNATETKTEEAKPVDKSEFKKASYTPISTEVTKTVSNSTKTITVIEGSKVKLNVKATDGDGDTLTYTFSSPLNLQGEWQTKKGDAGTYDVTISVSDSKDTVKKNVKILVEPKNSKPVLTPIKDVTVDEGTLVTLNVFATDSDGDTLTTTFSGWMDGPTKQTNFNDAGSYKVTVTVSDGIAKVAQEVAITVANVNQLPEFVVEEA